MWTIKLRTGRILVGMALILGAGASSAAPPSNDECSNAVDIILEITTNDSNVEATDSGTTRCAVTDALDVWYYVRGNGLPIQVSTCGSDFDTTVGVFEGCGGTQIACSDAAATCGDTNAAELTTPSLSNGQDYFIRVAGVGGATGNIALLVNTIGGVLPVNDECASATPVFENVAVNSNNVNATNSGAAFCTGNDPNDVWFSYLAPATQKIDISLCGSDFDTTLSVFDGCGGNQLVCKDQSTACGNPSSITCLQVQAATTYLIRVAGYEGDSGSISLLLTPAVCVIPANDDCANALPLGEGAVVSGVIAGATESVVSSCNVEDSYDVWYRYTPPSNTNVNIATCGSAIDTTLAIFDGCGGTELLCVDDAPICGTDAGVENFAVVGGSTYLIRVASYAGARGAFSLGISPVGAPLVTAISPSILGPTNSSSVMFEVSFNQEVQNFNDAADVVITENGVSHTGVAVSGSADVYSVVVSGLSGQGTLSLAVSTASGVESLAAVPLTYSIESAKVEIDTVAPVISGLSVNPIEAREGDEISIQFQSTEDLDGDPIVTVNGRAAERSAKAAFGYAYAVTGGDPVGPALIEVSGMDFAGNVFNESSSSHLTVLPDTQVPLAAWPLAMVLVTVGAITMSRRTRS